MAAAFDADVVDHMLAELESSRVGRMVRRIAGENGLLAWTCFRRSSRYGVLITDGEQVGLPYAALSWFLPRGRRPTHTMIVHVLSVRKKVFVFRALLLRRRIDQLLVYSTAQRTFAVERLGMRPEQVHLTSFMTDTVFFDPSMVTPTPHRMICAAGLEFRDYDTLVAAVDGIDVDVVIAAASPWSKRTTTVGASERPDNVTVCSLDLFQLRQLYADSMFVVMPLLETDFQAGVTTILEAMSMAKPVVCSRTSGQTDVIIDGETGIYVPPGDVAALRAAIVRLADDPERVEQLGAAARSWVTENADVAAYARRLAGLVSR